MKTLLFLLILFTLVVIPMSHYVAAHGVSTGGFAPSFGRIDDVSLSKQSIQTGETITITGKIVYMQQYHTQGWLDIHSDPGPHGRWNIVSTQPSEHLIDIPGNSLIPFSITVKALQPGIYHFSPEVYLVGIGPAMSSLNGNNRTEPIVVVTGKPICMQDLVAISKVEDNSSACVKSTTAQKLIERGWGNMLTPTAWFRYTILDPESGSDVHQGVPWSNYIPANISEIAYKPWFNGTTIKEYFTNHGVTVLEVRYSSYLLAGPEGVGTSPQLQTDFYFLTLQNDTSQMNQFGFKTINADPRQNLRLFGQILPLNN